MSGLPDSLFSSPKIESYATGGALGEDVDLVAVGGNPCRAIRVGQAGDLVVKDARDGSAKTIPSVTAGETVFVQAVALVASGTTAQKITVLW